MAAIRWCFFVYLILIVIAVSIAAEESESASKNREGTAEKSESTVENVGNEAEASDDTVGSDGEAMKYLTTEQSPWKCGLLNFLQPPLDAGNTQSVIWCKGIEDAFAAYFYKLSPTKPKLSDTILLKLRKIMDSVKGVLKKQAVIFLIPAEYLDASIRNLVADQRNRVTAEKYIANTKYKMKDVWNSMGDEMRSLYDRDYAGFLTIVVGHYTTDDGANIFYTFIHREYPFAGSYALVVSDKNVFSGRFAELQVKDAYPCKADRQYSDVLKYVPIDDFDRMLKKSPK